MMRHLTLERETPILTDNMRAAESGLPIAQPIDYAKILSNKRALLMGVGPIALNTVLAEHLADQALALRESGVTHYTEVIGNSLKSLDVIRWNLNEAGMRQIIPDSIELELRQNSGSKILALLDSNRLFAPDSVRGDTPFEIEADSHFVAKALLTGGFKGISKKLLAALRDRRLKRYEFMVEMNGLPDHISYIPVNYIIHLPGLNNDHA